MCEANAYIYDQESGEERLFLERVDRLTPVNDSLLLENIFGEKKYIAATIKELRLVEHRIILLAKGVEAAV
jgi:predicted RNA-binding protein